MKAFATGLLASTFLWGQAPTPVQVTPGTPSIGAPAISAPAASSVSPDTVVLEVAGRKYTAAEIDKLIAALPPQVQQNAHTQPQILNQLFLMKRLAEDAEKAGLDKQPPYQQALEFNRIQVLSQAQLGMIQNGGIVSSDDQEKYYKEHPEKFRQAKVRVIYVAFNPAGDKAGTDAKKLPSEAEAKAKIDDLRKQILAGADFGKLARDNSDDKQSAVKDGDFGTISQKSSYPDAIKAAVFTLKQGEVSEPVKQPNGFYLLRADELTTLPFAEVSTQLVQDLRQEHFNEVMKDLQTQYTVKVDNQAYFTPKPQPPQLQQVH
jgi:peptidyl-prolyl cis-trans isomerase C